MIACGMYVIVKPHMNEKNEFVSPSGLVIPNKKRPFATGTVLSVGSDVKSTDFKEGDHVVITPNAVIDVSETGDYSMLVYREHDIIAVVDAVELEVAKETEH